MIITEIYSLLLTIVLVKSMTIKKIKSFLGAQTTEQLLQKHSGNINLLDTANYQKISTSTTHTDGAFL